jgi:glutamine synthetase
MGEFTEQEIQALGEKLAAEGVEYAVGTFIDIQGRAKGKVVPIDHFAGLVSGSERYTPRGIGDLGELTPEEDECVALPDPSTLTVLPWDHRFAWMAADLLYGGEEPFSNCPRTILKRQLARAAAKGLRFELGVETEIYVFRQESLDSPSGPLVPIQPSGTLWPTPAYDLEASLDLMPFLGPMVHYMSKAGFGVFSFDAEGGDGQVEFDFAHAPALEMADRLTLFRLMAKQVAKESGLAVTFMPKPWTGAWGSGAHFNMSLVDEESGVNVFPAADDPRGFGWSPAAYGFAAGLIRHARSLAAVATPTVNSFKRLTPALARGEVSWAPIWAAYGVNNRSCMLRFPKNRPALENRAVDSAANTYVTAAMMLAAGLEGIDAGLDPGDPIEARAYGGSPSDQAVRLPRTLLEAIDAFAEDPLTHEVFPAEFVAAYTDMKLREWEEYHAQVGEWERRRYLTLF